MKRIAFVGALVIALMASLLVGCADKELTQARVPVLSIVPIEKCR